MNFRLNFDDNIHADLIEKIRQKANGGSLNKALQVMIIEWIAIENDRNLSYSSQKMAAKRPNCGQDDNSNEIDLEAVGSIFSD